MVEQTEDETRQELESARQRVAHLVARELEAEKITESILNFLMEVS